MDREPEGSSGTIPVRHFGHYQETEHYLPLMDVLGRENMPDIVHLTPYSASSTASRDKTVSALVAYQTLKS
jgi:hypothetical protein